jgi:tetratricopeptide (TPR) repeat protein
LELLEQDPRNPNLLAEASDLALALGDYGQTRQLLDRALQDRPRDPYFRHRRTTLAIAERDWPTALSTGHALLKEGVTATPVRYNTGLAALHSGEPALAKEALGPISAAPDAPADTRHLYVRALHYLGELEGDGGAIALAQAHLEQHPDDGEMAGLLSLLWLDAGDLEKARRWSAKALEQHAGSHEGLLAAGTVALGDEDEAKARETFDAAIKARPSSGRAWAGLGLASMLKLDLPAARRELEQAVGHMPNHIGTWHALAWCQLMQGDLEAAKLSFERSLAIDANFGETHGGLGSVAALQGRWDEAHRLAEIARRLDPASFSAKFVQLLELQRSGKGEAAGKLLERVLRGHPVPGGGTLADMLVRTVQRQTASGQPTASSKAKTRP